MAAESIDNVLSSAERELEESIAALNDLFEHNFIYMIPRKSDNGSSPQAIDVTQLISLSSDEQSKITTKLQEILPKLSKARRTVSLNASALNSKKNVSSHGRETSLTEIEEIFVEADKIYNIKETRTPNSSIFSNPGQMPSDAVSDAEKRFTDYIHRASIAFDTYEKSEYNDNSSKIQFQELIKNANKSLKEVAKSTNNNNSNNNNNNNNRNDYNIPKSRKNTVNTMFNDFDTLMQQADNMFEEDVMGLNGSGNKNDDEKEDNNNNTDNNKHNRKYSVADARAGVGRSLAIINEKLQAAARENEKLIAVSKVNGGK